MVWAPPSNSTVTWPGSPHLTSRSTMPTSLRCGNSAPRSVCWDRWSGGANGPGSRCRAVTRSGRVRWICTRRAYGNLGAHCNIEHGCVVARAETLRGAEIQLEFPSVGATENILMAAVVAEGVTTIHNAAREPDVVDLCTMLNQMGAQVEGAGSPTMTITGVPRLHPTEHRVIGDRIVAATWGIAAAMTRGDISVAGVDPAHLQLVLHKLHDAGATVTQTDASFRVTQYERPKAVNVATLPFPGFPTDLQPMAIALASIADGTSMITENVFEARFRFVEEMIRLGADARTDGHHAVVRGLPQLSSAPVWCSDIRAGAGLVLAGLVADGDTEVHDVFHIDRGYPLFVENLVSLGAEIERVCC